MKQSLTTLMIQKIAAAAVGENNDEDDGTDAAVIVVEKRYSLKYKALVVILVAVKCLNDNVADVVYYADADEYSDYCGNYCCRRKKGRSVSLAVVGS